MCKSIGDEPIDDPERVAEFIIESWSYHPGRQGVAHVADALAYMIPDVRDVPGGGAILEIDEDRGHAGARETAQEVQLRRFLQRAFQPLGNLLEHVVDTGARPRGLHHHSLDHERGVFVATEPREGEKPRNDCDDHQVDGQRPVLERPLRKVEGHITALTPAGEPAGPDATL